MEPIRQFKKLCIKFSALERLRKYQQLVVSPVLTSSSKCAFHYCSLRILKLLYFIITYATVIAVNIYTRISINSKVENKNLKSSLLGFGCNNTSVCFIIFSVHNLVHSALLRRFSRWASSSVFSAWPSFSSVNCKLG